MNDETRKALDKIFGPDNSVYARIVPIGASYIQNTGNDDIGDKLTFRGKFEVSGQTINKLRQLYDDAIAADDAAKLDTQRAADDKAKTEYAAELATQQAAMRAMGDKNDAGKSEDKSGDE